MFFIKRALLYVRRKKGKVLTIGAILFIVSTLVLTGLVIKTASNSAYDYARKSLGASVSYVTDMSSVMGENRTPGSGMGFQIPDDFTNITMEEIENIENGTNLLSDTLINATLAANATDFSYYDVNTEAASTRSDFGKSASINITGSNYSNVDNIFYNDNNTLIDGRYFTDSEIDNGDNVIIIESTIATLNELSVGDSITLSKVLRGRPDEETSVSDITYTIVGVYKTSNPTDASATDFRGSFNLTENTMYAPITNVLDNNGERIDSVTFTMNDPTDIESFINYVNGLGISYRSVNANDAAYEKMVGPISSVSNTASILVVTVILAGGLIIGLLSMLSIKDRKYELGVLLSLGESRIKIVSQLIFEMLIVSIASFILAIAVSNFTAQLTTNFLLNTAVSEVEEDTPEMGFGRGFNQFRNSNVTNVEAIEDLTVEVNFEDSAKMLGIGIFIIVIGNISQALFVLKANPKEILLER